MGIFKFVDVLRFVCSCEFVCDIEFNIIYIARVVEKRKMAFRSIGYGCMRDGVKATICRLFAMPKRGIGGG